MRPEHSTAKEPRGTFDFRPCPVTAIGPRLEPTTNPQIASFEERGFADRYLGQDLLGQGGMGEVRLHHDLRIGRDVAMKMIRPDRKADAGIQDRFLREARVQGQLEHPSIVPVYDVGIRPDGALYFTMKRLEGLTFAGICERLGAHDPAAEREYTPRKLLGAFGSVCLAVEFAHTRSVVHRDLKLSNVMLGPFGEVYVLDWGIASISGEVDDVPPRAIDTAEKDDSTIEAIVGTPGYLSPEQLTTRDVDGRSDVYSLGAILFHLLTLMPLHSGSLVQIIASTKKGADARCSHRAPDRDVPPELEAICVKATMADPADRFPRARDLYDAVQKYLDGDRDAERRRDLASEHARVASAVIESAHEEHSLSLENRAVALAELGRSVALDPSNETTLAAITGLLLEPPRELPDEVRAKLESSRADTQRSIAKGGVVAFGGGIALTVPFLMSMGIHQRLWVELASIFFSLAFCVCLVQMRRPSQIASYLVMLLATVGFMTLTRVFGPLVLVPSYTTATAMVYGMYPARNIQRAALAAMASATLFPLLLEWLHVLPRSYVFRGGELVIVPQMCALPEIPTTTFLVLLTSVLLVSAWVVVRRTGNALADAEEKLAIQAWQLRQLVPERTRHSVKL